jgi:hypothetical protein
VNIIGGQIVTGSPLEDHFRLAFSPAKETFDALAKLRPARSWLADWDQRDPSRNHLLLDLRRYPAVDMVDLANQRLTIIPDTLFLEEAKLLFHEAEHVPAPDEWYPLAFGVMLAAATNAKNVAPDYTFGLVDLILYDESVCEKKYEQGFSCAVVAAAIREVRRTSEFVPTAATIIKACQEHRGKFREHQCTVETLIGARQNAERVLAEFDRQYLELFGDDDRVEPIEPRPPGWRPPVYYDDEDVPF